MNRIDIKDLGGADYGRDVEIALRRRGWSNACCFVGEAHVQRIAIDVAVNGDRLDAHLFAGPDDATGNLAAIGDQDLLELARIKGHKFTPQKNTKRTNQSFVPFVPFCGLTLNSKEWLAVFNRLPILNVNFDYLSTRLSLNLVHEFHGFDNANHRFGLNVAADFHKRLGRR